MREANELDVTLDHGEAKPRILVVEDDQVARMMARAALEATFDVCEASNGAEGLTMFRKTLPQLVIMDVKMPVMDGFTACSHIRDSAIGRHTPILMLTGLEDMASIERAFEVGASDFAVKPINWLVLARRAEYMLRANRTFERLRRSQAHLGQAQRIARLGTWTFDSRTERMTLSSQMQAILCLPPQARSLSLDAFLDRIPSEDRARIRRLVVDGVEENSSREVEFCIETPDGQERHVLQCAEVVADGGTPSISVRGTVQDITERKKAEGKIRFLAYYDGLTGLSNRRSFLQSLGTALGEARERSDDLAVLLIDIDRFKRINDTLGHPVADELLRQVAARILESVRGDDFVGRVDRPDGVRGLVSRFGGDEFMVLLPGLARAENAASVARRLLTALEAPFVSEGQSIAVTASIGIAVSPADGVDGETMVKKADTAMHHCKDLGGAGFQFYSEAMNSNTIEEVLLESSLHQAVDNEQLRLFYQPLVDARTGNLVGAEALLRWQHPTLGLLSPDRFIPIAEESGSIVPIGEWVLRSACREASVWRAKMGRPMRTAVNISPRQLRDPGLVDAVASALESSGLEANMLELELTENTLLSDGGEPLERLDALKALGVRLSLDDFGTGFSSLSHLIKLPVDVVKIDRSFVAGVPEKNDHAALTRAIIAMGRSLGLEIVAEGVETEAAALFLRSEGCETLQGYRFGRPLSERDFGQRLREEAEVSSQDLRAVG